MNGACTVKLFLPAPWGPGEGPKGQISFNFNYKVNFKDFLFQTLCMFSLMKDTKHIRRDFYSVATRLGHAPGSGSWGYPAGSQFFFKHGHMAYQIDGDDEQNRMLVKFLTQGQTGDLGVRSKGQISLNFDYHVNSKIFIPNFVCILTNKI